jgi:hypothetical protein
MGNPIDPDMLLSPLETYHILLSAITCNYTSTSHLNNGVKQLAKTKIEIRYPLSENCMSLLSVWALIWHWSSRANLYQI